LKESKKTCFEDPKYVETRQKLETFNNKFKLYLLFSVLYGLVFVNFIDNIITGSSFYGYHLWLAIMYFFPFIILTLTYPKNWQLTLGLGLLASLMNDVFYGVIRNLMGFPLDLNWYFNQWLIPGNGTLFNLNLGFTVITIYSWMMAISIYARIIIITLLLAAWRTKTKIKCLARATNHNLAGFFLMRRRFVVSVHQNISIM